MSKNTHQGRKPLTKPTVPELRRLPRDFSWSLLQLLTCTLDTWLSDEEKANIQTVCRQRQPALLARLKEDWSPVETVGPSAETAQHLAVKLLLARMFSKDVSMGTVSKENRKAACLEGVYALDAGLKVPILDDPDPLFLQEMRRQVALILGPLPQWDKLNLHARHGPGSTALTAYARRSTYFKYHDWPYAVTPGCRELLRSCISADERWLGVLEDSYRAYHKVEPWFILNWDVFWQQVIKDQPANVITTVPKDGSKDRPIAKEPLGNVYCQTAIGSYIKSRLRTFGIDLTDQTKNQSLARLASVWESPLSPCTFDLSNASDTIHADLVRAVVPSEWYDMLAAVRSEWGEYPDRLCWRYAKMSSMGNATTFELESTLFYALIRTVILLHGDITDLRYTSVFGDDLIFPRYLAGPISTYIQACGFSVNQTKSFRSGSFFESCGKDWYSGINVRPVYCKEPPRDIMGLIGLRNRLNAWFARVFGTCVPLAVDAFFLKYIDGSVARFTGPEDKDATEGFWHAPPGACSVGRKHLVLVRRTKDIPARDFPFRKLMHSLASCDGGGDGSRFDVRDETDKVGVSSRSPSTLSTLWYEEDGVRQDHVRPPWETMTT